jgi:hypothetical protein
MANLHITEPGPVEPDGPETGDMLVIERAEQLWEPSTRRSFLHMLGIGGAVVMLPTAFAACDPARPIDPSPLPTGATVLDLSNDAGILNFAYALEQLEAGFYQAVVASTIFGTMNAEQREVFADLRNHEVIHREFLRQVLGSGRIGDLALNQQTVNGALGSIASILRTTEAFEDLGVAAYNGAGKYLSSAANLTVAGKIVSVEARHAAAIRDMREAMGISAGTPAGTRFAGDDVVIPSGALAGLDVKLEPPAVLARVAATNFVTTQIELRGIASVQGTPDFGPPSPTP